nr:SBBP repeat-containing protein [Pseudanabaena sp. FACHB-2040]
MLFTKQFGTSNFETIYGIATDPNDNLYVTGITAGDLAAPMQATDSDAFVAKYDSEGNQLWIEQFGQNSIFQSFGLDVDADGNAYLTGIDVKPSIDLATDDFWAAKFDTNGNQQWFTEVNGFDDAFDESYDITVSEDGSLYTTGWTLGDLEAPGANAGVYDAHITKFDNAGEREWIRQFGSSDYDWSSGIDTDSQGNVYAAGWTLGDLEGTNAGSYDVWLSKYDSLGNQQWLQQFGSVDNDQGFDLFIDSSDNLFLTGFTDGSLAGTNAGSFDAWAARYNTEGQQIWRQQFGTSDFDQAYAITGDNAGGLFVTGVTQGSFGDVSAGSFDSWVAKLDAESGTLVDFSGTSQPGKSVSSPSLGASAGSPQLTDEDISYINIFFEDFLASLNIDSYGTGLEAYLGNPYGQPMPPSAAVPEPSSGIGLLLIAAAAWASTKLRPQPRSIRKPTGQLALEFDKAV